MPAATTPDSLASILCGPPPSPEEALANVARTLIAETAVSRRHNGRGRRPTYAADAETIAQTGRHLAEMVLAYLDGRGEDLTSLRLGEGDLGRP